MANVTARSSKARLDRIHQNFRTSVENGKFYEASQMTKTLYFRYKSQKKYEEAESIIYESVLLLLQHEQHESAFELARLLVALYIDSKKDVSDGPLEKIEKILQQSYKSSESCKDFVSEALNWTSQQHEHGHPQIHLAAALKFWEEKDYQNARQHFIYTSDGSQCAAFLIEYHIYAGFPGEIDLFVTQAVLQFLCLRNTLTANKMFFGYTEKHPGIQRKCQPYKQPLLNFITFLLLVVEKGSLEQYTILCEQYVSSIHRDPTYPLYLDKIGQIFFGLPPPRKEKSGIDGMIGDLMESVFSGRNNDDVVMDAITEEVE